MTAHLPGRPSVTPPCLPALPPSLPGLPSASRLSLGPVTPVKPLSWPDPAHPPLLSPSLPAPSQSLAQHTLPPPLTHPHANPLLHTSHSPTRIHILNTPRTSRPQTHSRSRAGTLSYPYIHTHSHTNVHTHFRARTQHILTPPIHTHITPTHIVAHSHSPPHIFAHAHANAPSHMLLHSRWTQALTCTLTHLPGPLSVLSEIRGCCSEQLLPLLPALEPGCP